VSSDRRVVVVGGGLAGITAALDCADAGGSVTLLEVRRRLGGAAYSFEREGLHMDNGQHVFLRCCVAYRELLRRLGSEQRIRLQERLEIPVLKPGAATVTLRRSSLPAPLHLAGALARYRHLTPAQRLGAARAALALARLQPDARAAEEPTFGEWLARHGQNAAAVSALWDLIALPTLNIRAAQASLALSAFVFRTGLLSSAGAGDIGFHEATLGETIGTPAERALEQAGVELRLGWRVERLARSAGALEVGGRGARASGEDEDLPAGAGAAREELDAVNADAVILAVPHTRAAVLLEPLLGEAAAPIARIESSPIVNLHLVYDRPVLEHPFAAGVGTPVQYVFDRTYAAGAPAGTQYLAVSLSGAEREMQMSVPALRERYEPALRELLPRAREAKLETFLATREHAATFRASPGVGALRPSAQTGVPGLLLAGAWTDTGWPATLESAVLSGHTAASAALRELGIERSAAAQAIAAGEPRGADSAVGAPAAVSR
jgi:squalene-associated FAD-dependent desaturase